MMTSLLHRSRPQVREALRNLGLPESEVALLLSEVRLRTFQPGEFLTRIGPSERTVFLLLSGSVRATRRDGTSAVVVGDPHEPGVIGEVYALGLRLYRTADVEALQECRAVVVPAGILERFKDRLPVLRALLESHLEVRRASLEAALMGERERRSESIRAYMQALERTARP